jgi:predicted ATP-grasp superfamily ATP-dependent carboligase
LLGLTASVDTLAVLRHVIQRQRTQIGPSLEQPNAAQSQLPPVLLMCPGYCGTLAAVRALGRAGLRVTVAGPSRWSIAGASKYAWRNLDCPAPADSDALMAWLLDFGKRNERHALLATCDDTSWLYAKHREQLAKYFHLASPAIGTIHGLLHKGVLAEHASAVGLDVPQAWFPESEADLARVAGQVRFPVLVKPTTQALFPARSKGGVAEGPDDLRAAYAAVAGLAHQSAIVDYDASISQPLVQELFPDVSERIYNISGYVHDGKLVCAAASRKLLQRPRQLGTGLCFGEEPLDAQLALGIEQLAQRVQFNGVFEAEFVRIPGRNVLIDFNPRFYNQMGYDIARGLPLPLLAYSAAIGDTAALELARPAAQFAAPTGKVFVYGSAFKVMVKAQRLSGALGLGEADSWLRWYEEHAQSRVDAVEDEDDPLPGWLDVVQMLRQHLRHPRVFFRSTVRNR